MMKCSECDWVKGDVRLVADPFSADVNGEEVILPLCDDCYSFIVEEI